MMVHGWPGCFFEFYKILPLLTKTEDDIVFEVICPSIPGYGFSDAPQKQGTTLVFSREIFAFLKFFFIMLIFFTVYFLLLF